MSSKPPTDVKIVPASSFYAESRKQFDTDKWVGPHPGLWRGGNRIYIHICDMETDHLSSAISFVERRDPNFRKSNTWAELVAEYHKREHPLPAAAEELGKKRKFRLPD